MPALPLVVRNAAINGLVSLAARDTEFRCGSRGERRVCRTKLTKPQLVGTIVGVVAFAFLAFFLVVARSTRRKKGMTHDDIKKKMWEEEHVPVRNSYDTSVYLGSVQEPQPVHKGPRKLWNPFYGALSSEPTKPVSEKRREAARAAIP